MKIPAGFKGRAKQLEDLDLPRIGQKIGVGEDELHAFMDVEAAGDGFDRQGRPKMLREPHVFYRNLTGKKRDQAVKKGLAYRRWGTKPYPKDSYPSLMAAMEIDQTAALKSCSWGLGQVLGENHKAVGYRTVQEFVAAMCDDEEKHLEAMVEFLITNNLDDELRNHQWARLARGYNGPGYKKHNYHGRLAAAYRKWKRIPDTPFTIDDLRKPAPEPDPDTKDDGKAGGGVAGGGAVGGVLAAAGFDWKIVVAGVIIGVVIGAVATYLLRKKDD